MFGVVALGVETLAVIDGVDDCLAFPPLKGGIGWMNMFTAFLFVGSIVVFVPVVTFWAADGGCWPRLLATVFDVGNAAPGLRAESGILEPATTPREAVAGVEAPMDLA